MIKEAFKKAIIALNDLRGYGAFFHYELEDGTSINVDAVTHNLWAHLDYGFRDETWEWDY